MPQMRKREGHPSVRGLHSQDLAEELKTRAYVAAPHRSGPSAGGAVMPKTTQPVDDLESKPGGLAKLARTLCPPGGNITPVVAPQTARRGKARLLASGIAQA